MLPLISEFKSTVYLAFKMPDMAADKRTGRRSFKCSICKNCFNVKSALKEHLRVHSDERSYKCTQCDKRFKRAAGLYSHRKVHSYERPYKCTQCDKCFRWSSSLKRHLLIHTNKGPSNVLGVKNVSDAYPVPCKTICGYTVEKDPSSVLSVKSVS